ncbi:MAG: DUF3598 family protein [Cyanobacteria bacterium J06554_11]
MLSQWQCIQQNIGTWHGTFAQFSPDGDLVKETPSVLTLEETQPGQRMQLTLERTPDGGTTDITRRSFSAPGPAPYVYFFESGAFSQGTAQWSKFGQFGAEMSLKVGDRRVRFVIMYEGTAEGTSKIKYITLIREAQTGGTRFEEPHFHIEQVLGNWQGRLQMLYASMDPTTAGQSLWTFNEDLSLTCKEENEDEWTLALATCLKGDRSTSPSQTKPISLKKNKDSAPDYQLTPLPNGTYCLMPQIIDQKAAFRVEVGWVRSNKANPETSALIRTRIIRYYDHQGIWRKSALIEDSPAV